MLSKLTPGARILLFSDIRLVVPEEELRYLAATLASNSPRGNPGSSQWIGPPYGPLDYVPVSPCPTKRL